mgnify:CR=1 FL=1
MNEYIQVYELFVMNGFIDKEINDFIKKWIDK